ncbi:hypothetical protein GUJ93_ZPchr0010g7308 [Zizania palustris]|uniref:Uncharacterized protein n=1 Tax=Zizania palustris TaxID=103762 RepID=A0A8J5WA62_ZIZPA|nr:hypothetical protein GUJ93_ZPchr0010g7308 [Zizania palustris]
MHQRHPTQPVVEPRQERQGDLESGSRSGDGGDAAGGGSVDDTNRNREERLVRFREYSKRAFMYEFPLVTALLMPTKPSVVGSTSARWHGFRIYASGVLLMSMPFCLLLSLNVLYAFLAVALSAAPRRRLVATPQGAP